MIVPADDFGDFAKVSESAKAAVPAAECASAPAWRLSATAERVLIALQRAPSDDRAALEPLLRPSIQKELRAFRLRAAVTMAARMVTLGGGPCDPWPLAGRLREDLERYAGGRWRFEGDRSPPTDATRASLHAVLTETDGAVLSHRHIYRLLTSAAAEMSVKSH